jgi:3-hydroxyisobutyrate dehydrogenase
MEIGFIGLGFMGEPVALNLARAGHRLVVWNRSPRPCQALAEAGAAVADGPGEVFARCGTVLVMLASEAALDQVLGRGTPGFGPRVKDRLLVNLATCGAAYAKGLEAALLAEGGRYVEAPVSGSRVPAERGQLVAMMAGTPGDLEQVRPLLAPLCRQAIPCGPVPGGTLMKFATLIVNVATITALAEATQFARRQGLDLERFNEAVLQGPLASDVARVKAPKLAHGDFAPQAAIRNVIESHRLVVEAAREAGIATPVEDTCLDLYRRALAQGLGDEDMVAVVKVYEAMGR